MDCGVSKRVALDVLWLSMSAKIPSRTAWGEVQSACNSLLHVTPEGCRRRVRRQRA
jgi:hypothetical protein